MSIENAAFFFPLKNRISGIYCVRIEGVRSTAFQFFWQPSSGGILLAYWIRPGCINRTRWWSPYPAPRQGCHISLLPCLPHRHVKLSHSQIRWWRSIRDSKYLRWHFAPFEDSVYPLYWPDALIWCVSLSSSSTCEAISQPLLYLDSPACGGNGKNLYPPQWKISLPLSSMPAIP